MENSKLAMHQQEKKFVKYMGKINDGGLLDGEERVLRVCKIGIETIGILQQQKQILGMGQSLQLPQVSHIGEVVEEVVDIFMELVHSELTMSPVHEHHLIVE